MAEMVGHRPPEVEERPPIFRAVDEDYTLLRKITGEFFFVEGRRFSRGKDFPAERHDGASNESGT